MGTLDTCFYSADTHPTRRHEMVVLNARKRPISELAIYAKRYWEAGKILREKSFLENAGYNDADACPVVYLYRHAIELYLKAIAIENIELRRLDGKLIDRKVELQRILGGQKKKGNGHMLCRLFPELKRALELSKSEWGLDVDGLRTLDDVHKVLQQIDELDAGSFSFRYPIQKDGIYSSLPPNTSICIACICTRLDTLLQMFEGIAEQIRLRISEKRLAIFDVPDPPTFCDYTSYPIEHASEVEADWGEHPE